MRGLLTAAELSRPRIERLLAAATEYRDGGGRRHPSAIVGLAFFEPSLRTRVGFDVAAGRLGARSVTVQDAKQSAAMAVPESLLDTVRSIAAWLDVLCLRHPDADAARRAAMVTETPIINCGNGGDEHPSQALVDLFALQHCFGRIDGLRLALVGDLNAMRAAHSLVGALSCFDGISLRCISPHGLELAPQLVSSFRARGHSIDECHELMVEDVDVVYVAGLPAPTRAGILSDAQQAAFRVTGAVVDRLDRRARVLCALPRVDEIAHDVDARPQAAYFLQSELALSMRMAVLDEALSEATG
jgi:aspartate carbamoyltransferase catalytic subunit